MIALLIILIIISVAILFILLLIRIKRSSCVNKILSNYPTQVAALCRSKIGEVSREITQSILAFPFDNWNDWKNKQDELILTSKNFSDVISAYILLYFPYVEKVPHFADCKLFDPAIMRCKILIECLQYNDILQLANISNEEWAKRKETKIAADAISLANPEAIKELRGKDSSLDDNDIIKHQKRIEQIQKRYTIASSFEEWLKRQEEFSKLVRNLRNDYADECGCYTYDIQFEKPLSNGQTETSTFKIWQIFFASMSPYFLQFQPSYQSSLYYELEDLKNTKRYYSDENYDKILPYIQALSKNKSILVIFNNSTSYNWGLDSYNYHYQYFSEILSENGIEWIAVEDLPQKSSDLNFDIAFIFDFITTNKDLSYLSKMIIESFSISIPTIVWYSMIKEYDEDETKALYKDAIEDAEKKKSLESDKSKMVDLIKEQFRAVKKHPFFSYYAITNTLIGEAANSHDVKPIWLPNPKNFLVESIDKDKEKKNYISIRYSVDGGITWTKMIKKANYEDIDDVVTFTYELFLAMDVLSFFIDKGHKAIESMNYHGYLAHR